MSKIKELLESRSSVYAKLDELRKSTTERVMTGEERAAWDKLNNDYDAIDQRIKDEESFVEKEKRQIEQAANTENRGGKEPHAEERTAFVEYLRSGDRTKLAATQSRAADSLDGLTGAVITPTLLHNEIEIALKSFGGMTEAGTIMYTANGNKLVMPTINDTASRAKIVKMYEKNNRDKPQFDSIEIGAYTYRTDTVPLSLELLQDSQFNLEQVVGALMGTSFARGLNEDLTTGDGVEMPKGIVTSATAIDSQAAANSINLDDLIALMAAVDSAYGNNGKFMLNRQTLFALRALKGTDGRFIWNESVAQGFAPTIFGKDYITNDHMPNIGAGNASVLFGDLSKYRIRMVRNFSVVRLNEILAEYLAIGLMGFARADGVLMDAGTNPVKKLVHAAA